MNSGPDCANLEDACKALEGSIEKYQIVQKLGKNFIHYKEVNIPDIRLNEAACYVSMACLKCLLAENSLNIATKRDALVTEVEHHLNSAKVIYSDLSFHVNYQLDSKHGMANILKEMGNLRYFQNRYEDAHDQWTQSCTIFEEIGDGSAVSELRKKLDKLHLMNEITMYSKTLLERKGENHERDAIYKAFKKFDKDNSGEMDASEFAALSIELGTFPALTMDEIKEAFLQLDSSADNKISFAEFWIWWSTDEIQSFLGKRKPRL